MWKLTEDTLEIVRQLYELRQPSSWFEGKQREQSILFLLDQLDAANEPGALPCVASFLLTSSKTVQISVRSIIAKLISLVSPYELIHLNDCFSYSYQWYVSGQWNDLTPSKVASVAGSPNENGYSDVLGLLSFHPNGYRQTSPV